MSALEELITVLAETRRPIVGQSSVFLNGARSLVRWKGARHEREVAYQRVHWPIARVQRTGRGGAFDLTEVDLYRRDESRSAGSFRGPEKHVLPESKCMYVADRWSAGPFSCWNKKNMFRSTMPRTNWVIVAHELGRAWLIYLSRCWAKVDSPTKSGDKAIAIVDAACPESAFHFSADRRDADCATRRCVPGKTGKATFVCSVARRELKRQTITRIHHCLAAGIYVLVRAA